MQFERCAPYRRFARARGATPERVRRWQEIPALPTGAFKEFALRGFAARDTVKIFCSSGTTLGQQSALHLDTLALYEAATNACFTRGMLPDLEPRAVTACDGAVTSVARAEDVHCKSARARLLVLAPSAEEAPDSSLSHMFEVVRRERGTADSKFFVARGALLEDAFCAALESACAATDGAPVLLCGTAFAFVHALDALAARGLRFRLPAGARIMETGGFKGRAREIAQPEFYARLADAFGVPPSRIVNQYGMTELGSQFYDGVLQGDAAVEENNARADATVEENDVRAARARKNSTPSPSQAAPSPPLSPSPSRPAPSPPPHAAPSPSPPSPARAQNYARWKRVPPWVRVRVLHPATGLLCAPGEPGLLQIHDLANTGSVAALLTADLGRMRGAPDDADCAFEVLGRAPGAEARGCSIAADDMLDARA